jgi:hypothetical protein
MRGRSGLLPVVLSAAISGLIIQLAVGVPAAGAAPPANIDISRAPGNEAENAIAINPTNPQNIVAMSVLPDVKSGTFVGTSFDGGTTWTTRVIGKGKPLGKICCDQQLAFDRYGNLWMTYLLNTTGNVPIALSTDGGLTFKKVTEIVPTSPTGSRSGHHAKPPKGKNARSGNKHAEGDQPSIATGPNSVWVSYTSYPSKVVQAAGARVTGLGAHGHFRGPESVPTEDGRGNYGDTGVGPDGEVMAIYQSRDNGQGGSTLYTALDPDGLGPAGFEQPRFLARTRIGGFDYIAAKPNRSIDAEANLAWDQTGGAHNGRVYAVFTDELGNESDDINVMVRHSDDDGTTWSPKIELNDDGGTNSQFDPAIALDQATGFVGVSWYDARNDMGLGGQGDTDGIPNDDAQIWATYSQDGGASFAPNFQVSEGTSSAPAAGSSFDYGDYTHAAFQSHRFYPAWSDNSNSTGENPDGTLNQFDLFTAKVVIP